MILLFASLMLFSELKAVFINGVSVSPGWMIGMASIVAFRGHSSLLGPVIIGMVAGVDLLRLRHREWSTLSVNIGMLGFAYLAAAFGYSLLPDSLTMKLPAALLAPIVPTLFYVIAVCSLFAAGRGRLFRHLLARDLRGARARRRPRRCRSRSSASCSAACMCSSARP